MAALGWEKISRQLLNSCIWEDAAHGFIKVRHSIVAHLLCNTKREISNVGISTGNYKCSKIIFPKKPPPINALSLNLKAGRYNKVSVFLPTVTSPAPRNGAVT